MKIIGTGLTGLVGSRIVELLSDRYQFENISRTSGVDIINKNQVENAIEASDADVILHLAAATGVDACEKEKGLGKESNSYKLNVEATESIAKAAKESQKKLIYISTDFVFDGNIDENVFYSEEDTPHPINWYGMTKYMGEQVVRDILEDFLILRISYPFSAQGVKKDFVRFVLSQLQAGESLQMVSDHIMTPTFIDDIAIAIDALINNNSKGIFHVVGSDTLSPYDSALSIASLFGIENPDVRKTTREEFFVGRAERPFCLALKNDKIEQLGVKMRTFEEGLREIKQQLNSSS